MDPTELHRAVIDRSVTDPDFRARLLAEPRETLAEFVGEEISAAVAFRVIEEDPTEVLLVLPPASGAGVDDKELVDVSGGWVKSAPGTSGCTYYLTCHKDL